jgi:hypothetical protein
MTSAGRIQIVFSLRSVAQRDQVEPHWNEWRRTSALN